VEEQIIPEAFPDLNRENLREMMKKKKKKKKEKKNERRRMGGGVRSLWMDFTEAKGPMFARSICSRLHKVG